MDILAWQNEPSVQRALASLADIRPVIETVVAIQQVPAPTFDEQERSALVKERFTTLKLGDIHSDALGNVYGRRRGRGPGRAVLVSAHTDTVFPRETDLSIRYEGERIYGPSIGDNSTGVAGLLHLAQTLQHFDISHRDDIWFVANVCEEGLGDLRGMRAAVEHLRSQLNQVIVLEGCDFGTIHHQAIAVRRYRILVRGSGGHSWGNFGVTSAVHVLVQLAARLTEISVPGLPRTTYNIGVIEGGTSVNTIAEQASLLLDMRSVDLAALTQLVARVDTVIATFTLSQRDVQIMVEQVGARPAGAIGRDHGLVRAATAAYQAVGASINYQQSSTDANIPLSMGIPAVCVGLTDGGNAHRSDEYIVPANLGRGMQALLLLTLAAAEL
ncbi:M20/M25/M40 family metallo-hydrolase [Candidatus Gracilibacteria bacterium]|nr:M20/M25/M40 family metallo-hydrolase [Candidatus Gracilibacteria bacterium]